MGFKDKLQKTIFSFGIASVVGPLTGVLTALGIAGFAFLRNILTPGGLGMGILFYFFIMPFAGVIVGLIAFFGSIFFSWNYWGKHFSNSKLGTKVTLLALTLIPTLVLTTFLIVFIKQQYNNATAFSSESIEDCFQFKEDDIASELCLERKKELFDEIADCELVASRGYYNDEVYGNIMANLCIERVAINKKDPSVCFKIVNKTEPSDKDLSRSINQCLGSYIFETKDTTACPLLDRTVDAGVIGETNLDLCDNKQNLDQ